MTTENRSVSEEEQEALDALDVWRRSVAGDPGNAGARSNLGGALLALGQLRGDIQLVEESVDEHLRAVSLYFGNKGDIYSNLAHAYLVLGSMVGDKDYYEKAKDVCERAEAMDTGSAAYNLACAEALLGNRSAAVKWLKKAISLDETQKESARADEDLASLRGDPNFDALVSGGAAE